MDQEQIEGFNGLNQRTGRSLWLVGRLKPGVTAEQADADLHSIATFLTKTYPKDDDGLTFSLARPGLLGNLLGRPVRAFVAGLMLLAGLILLAACANLGSLFAARAADRSREIALRLALGSTRRHILRQLLTEAILVALTRWGRWALPAAWSCCAALSAWQPLPTVPINLPVHPDALTYTVALLSCAGQRPYFWAGSGAPDTQGRSMAGGEDRLDNGGRRPVVWHARRVAGGADCVMRCAGHVFAGSGTRPGAIAA